MTDSINRIIKEAKLFCCIECGKCVAACPMGKIDGEFPFESFPRVILRKALLGYGFLEKRELWLCYSCKVCSEICPKGVRYREFIEAIRLLAIEGGIIDHCSFCERCGKYFLPTPQLDNIRGEMEKRKLSNEFLNLCPKCRRYDFLDRVKKTL